LFGTGASTTYPIVDSNSFSIYRGGSVVTPVVEKSVSVDVPSSGVVTAGLTDSFILQENNEINVPISFLFEGRTTAGAAVSTGSYAVGFSGLNWVSLGVQDSSTFMSGKTSWRTSTISLP